MGQAFINSLGLLVIGSSLTFVAGWFWWQKNAAVKEAERLAREHSQLEERVREMEQSIAKVKQEVVPITAAFQAVLIKQLTHFHTPRLDELLVKVGPPNTLTQAEAEEMAEALLHRSQDMGNLIDESERDAATMLPLVIKRSQREEKEAAEAHALLLVTVPLDKGQAEAEAAEAADKVEADEP